MLEDSVFEEIPVELEEFVTSRDFLGFPPLSENQLKAIKASTQIFRKETLFEELYPNNPEKAQARWEETNNEVVLAWGKGCHAPYTPVFNAKTGNWQRLDSFRDADNEVVGYTDGELKREYATESFQEGFGEMLRVTTKLGFVEDVYIGHKYYGYGKYRFYHRLERGYEPQWKRADELKVGDKIAVGVNFDIDGDDIPESHAIILGYWAGDGNLPTHTSKNLSVDFGEGEKESLE